MTKKGLLKTLYLILYFALLSHQTDAQVFINEFMASNTGSIVDPDYNESADWLELYNAGNSSVNLSGYFLSDNFSDPSKWQIPAGTQIEAKGFLMIWADGYDIGLHTNFKISADGEELGIYNSTATLIDTVTFGLQEPNISMGRKTDGGAEWGVFIQPTPGAANSNENFDGVVYHVPHYSVLGGIFSSPVTVEIANTFGGEIHYTTDGSEPTENSPLVSGPINVDTTTVLRSRIYQAGKIPGKVVTNTYFIDPNHEIGTLPVVSLSSNPDNFWDAEKGIYVQDFKPEWEIPVNIELFENDGSDRAGFNERAGVKVNGLYSWQLPQKMLGVYFRNEYGAGKLDYPLLFVEDRSTYDNFALRASGSDWAYSLFRDGMTQSLTDENMDIDYQGFRAAVLYINGRYMGINNLRSKIDESFIVEKHHLGDQKIDMIENESYVETGSLDQYAAFEEAYHKDLSVQENYDAVAELMDMENFTDFVITEIYSQNTSVDHNIMAWKPQNGGKWKWILNDLDRGFFNYNTNPISFYANRDVIPLSDLLQNEGYRHYFGKRLADHLFTTFDPERVKAIIDDFKANIEDEVPKHVERWKGTRSSYGDAIPSVDYWNNEVNKMKSFAEKRSAYLLNDLQKYGFEASALVSLTVSPEKAGTIDFNGISIRQSASHGAYPGNEEIEMVAKPKSGYVFKGWQRDGVNTIIEKEAFWKYDDSGNEPDENWKSMDFDDTNWSEGQAELGYGDNAEKTVIGFGGDSGNKNITTYFRKTFTIENADDIQSMTMNLKYDDGAVVYMNGIEVARINLPEGEISSSTTALSAIGGAAESAFTTFQLEDVQLDTGSNIIAVEIHQVSGTSSDISFDLELSAYKNSSGDFFSTEPALKFTHTTDESWTAVFESDGSCVLPEEISELMILNKACSPYRVPDDVTITESGKLRIEPGVELWFSDDVSLEINGILEANGTKSEPVIFTSNPESSNQKWGILNFVNADTSRLNNVIIEDASKGTDPIREIAAVSIFHSVLDIDGAVIENVYENPVLGRYSNVTMKNSRLHSEVTGDLINLKYGLGLIDSCEFSGNNMPDTDGVDFDDIENGVIRNSVIHDFHGFNSDAIDIGEQAKNISIENMEVYNITDKGVSVGQQSSAKISNSLFVNCNLGAGLKDSSDVIIDHCTYYGNGTSVDCFEKNEGDAGGNAVVTNSILSNAYDASYSSDSKSTLKISYSSADNDELPAGKNNLFVDPEFKNPNLFDFSLEASSSCINTAKDGNMGASLSNWQNVNQLFISGIAYKSDVGSEIIEFIKITNSGTSPIDISGFAFTKGVTFTFPENTTVEPGEDVYVTNDINLAFWQNKNSNVYQWESGRLADEGEAIQLETPQGIVVDKVNYNSDDSWPDTSTGEGLSLKSDKLDNHFGANWQRSLWNTILPVEDLNSSNSGLTIYPNPTTGIIHISGLDKINMRVEIFNLNGVAIKSGTMNDFDAAMNIGNLDSGIYIVKINGESSRIVLLK